MAITTVDQALAGMLPARQFYKVAPPSIIVSRWLSLWSYAGCPAAGGFNATAAGAVYSSSTTVPNGAIWHTDPATGNSYLANFTGTAPQIGTLLLCDRLWDNTLSNVTTSQTIGSPTWPARDLNDATAGVGVHIGIEVQSVTSATALAISAYSYTNSGLTSGRTGGLIVSPGAVAQQQGFFLPLYEQAGDAGVNSIQSIQFSTAYATGTIGLVAYTVLSMLEITQAWSPNRDDVLTACMPQLDNGVCPFIIFIPETTTVGIISAVTQETQG